MTDLNTNKQSDRFKITFRTLDEFDDFIQFIEEKNLAKICVRNAQRLTISISMEGFSNEFAQLFYDLSDDPNSVIKVEKDFQYDLE